MKDQRLDTLARGITTVHSRRKALALLVGGGALAGLGSAEARKGGNGKGKHKGKGKGKGKGQTKVFICHRSDDSINLIRVGSPAVKGHSKHDDIVCEAAGPCQTGDPTACDQVTGACIFTQVLDGTACTTETGGAGTCNAGVCEI